jgi:ribosome-associated translation inhibitor RaiA
MGYPLQITFRDMPPSAAIESQIREKAAKLDLFYDRIMSCRVIVQAPHRHHHKGKAYQVSITIGVPGPDIVINHPAKRLSVDQSAALEATARAENHRPSKHGAHEDVYVALRDAFHAAERKLQLYARRQNGAVKSRRSPRRVGQEISDREESSPHRTKLLRK